MCLSTSQPQTHLRMHHLLVKAVGGARRRHTLLREEVEVQSQARCSWREWVSCRRSARFENVSKVNMYGRPPLQPRAKTSCDLSKVWQTMASQLHLSVLVALLLYLHKVKRCDMILPKFNAFNGFLFFLSYFVATLDALFVWFLRHGFIV